MTANHDYAAFLQSKSQAGTAQGFDPLWLPPSLFPFQAALTEWAIRKGRAAIFASCGTGKTLMQLVWAENVARKTNGRVLILTPLAVSGQTVLEAEKFGVEAAVCRDGKPRSRIVVTNYERLHHFDPDDFEGVVGDEGQILKNFDGKTRAAVTEFARTRPYRLLCTATPAPNDYDELGTSSEALGGLGYQDMLTRFFKQETKKDYLGWGRTKYRLRGHAEEPFWRWVCSWARACRKPSDLGPFDDSLFVLPDLVMREHEVKASRPAEGFLFDVEAVTLQEQQEAQRRTIPERCAMVAELVDHDSPALVWCHLNGEADLCEKLIPGAVQVSGSDRDEVKEERFLAFAAGQVRVLVTKPKIGALGMNFQHCAHQTFFPSHSFEQWHQGVRRSWRFGQKNPVVVDIITTSGAARVLANLRRKADAAEAMFSRLVAVMNRSQTIERTAYGDRRTEAPAWLASTR